MMGDFGSKVGELGPEIIVESDILNRGRRELFGPCGRLLPPPRFDTTLLTPDDAHKSQFSQDTRNVHPVFAREVEQQFGQVSQRPPEQTKSTKVVGFRRPKM